MGASNDLKSDADFMTAAVERDCRTVQYAATALKSDHAFMLHAAKQSSETLYHVAADLLASAHFVLAVLSECGELILEMTAKDLLEDDTFQMRAFAISHRRQLLERGAAHGGEPVAHDEPRFYFSPKASKACAVNSSCSGEFATSPKEPLRTQPRKAHKADARNVATNS